MNNQHSSHWPANPPGSRVSPAIRTHVLKHICRPFVVISPWENFYHLCTTNNNDKNSTTSSSTYPKPTPQHQRPQQHDPVSAKRNKCNVPPSDLIVDENRVREEGGLVGTAACIDMVASAKSLNEIYACIVRNDPSRGKTKGSLICRQKCKKVQPWIRPYKKNMTL
jgi:hypothetical protein